MTDFREESEVRRVEARSPHRPGTASELESELKTQLCLEVPSLISFRGDCAEVRIVDAVFRIVGLRMVQDIGGVKPDLYLFAFGDLKALAQTPVKRPRTRPCNRPLPECSARAGQRVLQHNPA